MRDVMVKVRTSTVARSVWQKSAEGSGETLSDYIRTAINAFRKGDTADVRAELVELRREINRLGSNVNQCVARANAGDLIDGDAIEAAFSQMKDAVNAALRERRG